MVDVLPRIVASVVCATLFCLATVKLLGAMQQGGYKNGAFSRWLGRKGNMALNRLCVLAVSLTLVSALTALCFSFLGVTAARAISAVPFFILCLLYIGADGKYALKVPLQKTGRVKRLFAVYWLFTACGSYLLLALFAFLAAWNGSQLFGMVAFAPYGLAAILLPLFLCAANGVTGIFENARNRKFVKRAGQVLDKTEIIRVGVVGSYGKTTVKNILKTVLSEKYAVVETPLSYNTPMGVAKTVFSPEFEGKQVLIAEMGARKKGDIAELCASVKPDYAVFTGVCEQHIQTFGSLENVWLEKSEILRCGAKKVVCGEGLKVFGAEKYENAAFPALAQDVRLGATETQFTLTLGEKKIEVKTSLLGNAAVENIALAATLAYEMGMTAEEIGRGLAKLLPVAHRLQCTQADGIYILDDGYNGNPRGAKEAIEALKRFNGGKCLVTPGLVECGVLEEELNRTLGEEIASAGLDKVVLVGQTLVGAVKLGYIQAGGDAEKLTVVKTLSEAQETLKGWLQKGDCVLFLNDLPDVY